MRKLLLVCAALFLAAHLPFLPASLGDLDSINFALAVREFDVAANQPHPPGYPIFVGLAKLTTAGLFRAGDPLNAAHALALLNILGGALTMIAVFALARALDYERRPALGAAIVTATIPLFWFSAARPLSDLLAIACAVGAQALIVRAWRTGALGYATGGAALAGAAMGIGPAAGLLTLPLLVWVLVRPGVSSADARVSAGRLRAGIGGGLAVGLLAWIVPLVRDAGALDAWRAIASTFTDVAGRASLRGVPGVPGAPGEILVEQARAAFTGTFVDPFGNFVLAVVVLTCAGVGLIATLVRNRAAAKTLAILFLPYLVVHLVAHDPGVDRLSLPLMVPIGLLFVMAFALVSPRAVLPAVAGAAVAGLIIVFPALQTFASTPSTGFAVIADLHRLPRVQQTVLAMHEGVAADLARHQAWAAIPPMRTLPSPVDYEWYELAKLWQSGYEGPIWFLADPRRTDLRLIDPQSRTLLREYGWSPDELPYVGGMRPNRLDWYFMQRPGWFLGQGWALTPEIGRVTAREVRERGGAPAVAWVRRRAAGLSMAIGGRHLGEEGDPPIVLGVSVDGVIVDEWPIAPGPFLFMRPLLPEEMAGDATYARLEIAATWAGPGVAPVSLEQFDLQPIDGAMAAYDQGWWAPEHDARTGRTSRWTSGEATLWLYNPGHDLSLVLTGEAPSGRTMLVLAGDVELGRFDVSGEFSEVVTVPAEALSVARGRVTIRAPEGIRIFDVRVH